MAGFWSFTQHPRFWFISAFSGILLFLLLSQAIRPRPQADRHKRDFYDSTEIPAEHIDPAAIDLTPLVNTLINSSQSGSRQLFSLLSVTSYSSLALHKLTLLVYNISSIRSIESGLFRRRFCYCVTNETNDLTDFTAILLDVMGNSTSYLHELFKSSSILSVSQRNNSECIYICVMAGKTGRDIPDLWEVGSITPLFNQTIVEGPHTVANISSFRLPAEWNQLPTNLSHISPSGTSSMLTGRVHSTAHASAATPDETSATAAKVTNAQLFATLPPSTARRPETSKSWTTQRLLTLSRTPQSITTRPATLTNVTVPQSQTTEETSLPIFRTRAQPITTKSATKVSTPITVRVQTPTIMTQLTSTNSQNQLTTATSTSIHTVLTVLQARLPLVQPTTPGIRTTTPSSIITTTPISGRTTTLISIGTTTPSSSRYTTSVSIGTTTPSSSRTTTSISIGTTTPSSIRTTTSISSRTTTPRSIGTTTPSSSRTTTPRNIGTTIPRSIGTTTTSSGRFTTPRSIGTTTPRSIGTTTPRSSGTTTPRSSGTTTPRSSGTTTPSGSRTTTPSSSGTTTPSSSGTTTPSSSGTTTPSSSGTTTPSSSGTTTPSSSGTTTPSSSGTTTPISSRTTTPISRRTTTTSRGRTTTPRSTGTSTPSSGRTTTPSSSGTTTPITSVETERPGCPWRRPVLHGKFVSITTTTVSPHKLQPCVLELCKFFSQCLCRPFGYKTSMKRYCDDSHLWYEQHTFEVCRRVRRISFSRNLKQRCLTKMCNKL